MRAVLSLFALVVAAQAAVNTTSIKNKWVYGYQGWYRKPGGTSPTHWSDNSNDIPGPGKVNVDFIPDVSGYPQECLFDTNFILPNGSKAQFYDNTCEGVVDYHVKLASDAGVDGFAVQRFLANADDDSFITVLEQMQAACEKYGVGFFVEYDVSGANSAKRSVTNEVMSDFNAKIKNFTTSSAYFKEDGKPVVMAYGVGFPAVDAISVDDGVNLINTMKAAGYYFGIGVPEQWGDDVRKNSGFAAVYKACDFLSPWNVGGYSYAGYKPGYVNQYQSPDVALAQSIGIGYAPSIFPGTSAYHLNGVTTPKNFDYFPRYNGSFLQVQAETVIGMDITFVFVAMFDEVSEGTQNYPALKLNQLPTNEKFDGLDNDFSNTNYYLEQGGKYAAQLHAKST